MANGNVTESFKQTIKSYLDERASGDKLFAERYSNSKKNIDDCCTYIVNQVRALGRSGYSDDEICGMAVHYYDEDKIDIGDPVNCKVIVNHSVELTQEEKEVARQAAIKRLTEEQYFSMKKKVAKKKTCKDVEQMSLF